ncbi:hypothetical protein SAMN04488550_0260 [Gordonia malaquae]|uniref:Uncharacterized protein n=1 Tax=Gordonia malaquae NBRC 108250 TaxID=1223542 RepID=M3VFU4_GORML|nr:hypothetical protein [Gordonia malaquae]GAC80379.1 hypothetical protein GM1_017_00370 [Gordonia malaquae NBRC 108250]SEB52775.1 hypothetical protein SAMN04488550_0260 [Gordonia malaquae]
MPTNPRRGLFGRRSQSDRATPAQLAALTDAFFACERAMGDMASAVQAAQAVAPGSIATAEWDGARDRYDQVISRYLVISADDSPEATPANVEQCTRAFVETTEWLGRYAAWQASGLQAGRAAINGAAQAEQQARVAANQALTALDQAPVEHAHLTSVRTAADALAQDLTGFEAATGLTERQRAADLVVEAAHRVIDLLDRAPGLTAETEKTMRSLATRRQAVETKLDGLPAVMSQLLRDFSSECSIDLVDVPEDVRHHLQNADERLDRARVLLGHAPDEARAATEQARAHLADADEQLDRVVDRLSDLRDVRADPTVAASRVRFRIRDAQNFAVDNHQVREWGSVLDAQNDRVDRAAAVLERIHPDYWFYLSELRAVDARVTDIIGRMRDHVSRA